jgi:hypothetical protein
MHLNTPPFVLMRKEKGQIDSSLWHCRELDKVSNCIELNYKTPILLPKRGCI